MSDPVRFHLSMNVTDLAKSVAFFRTLLGVGPEFEYELLGREDWIGRRLVADRFRQNELPLGRQNCRVLAAGGGHRETPR